MTTLSHPEQARVWARYADALQPDEPQSPAEFARAERILHPVYCTERPGKWDDKAFPYQAPLMNMGEEAIRAGKQGVVYMKSGQGGGTDLAINVMLWLKKYFPGPQLFMASTEKVASEFGRERFANIIPDMPSLARKYRPNVKGDILTKRFDDGKIQLSGGQSVFNLQSTPYRIVGVDELDSLVQNLAGQGDPVKLAMVRMDSFTGSTLMIAYAHPTTKDKGAAKIYFEDSDQRRGHVIHAACGACFWLQWEHVKVCGNLADPKEKPDPKDPEHYHYCCPSCGEVIEDAERVAMVRKVEYKSVLPPEVAKKKTWIGGHFSQLYYPGKAMRSLAQRWIDCGEDENAKMVFYNKVLGEPYELKIQKLDLNALRTLIVVKRRANDPEFYLKGQVPPGVRFLTAGQDSRAVQLHYSVWGWGNRRTVDGASLLCGWLIDWGIVERRFSTTFSSAEFHVFDDLLYTKKYPSTNSDRVYQVRQCGHDVGYAPTLIPILTYCRDWPDRAVPVKGASETPTSASKAPYARWSAEHKHKAGAEIEGDPTSRILLLNTYILKTDLFGMMDSNHRIEVPDMASGLVIGTRKVARVTLPEDVDDSWLEETKNEGTARGKRAGELVWKKTGPNHFADCNTYAHGCAMNLDIYQKGMTAEEYQAKKRRVIPRNEGGGATRDSDRSMA